MASNVIVSKDGFISLDDLKDCLDVSRVVYYNVKTHKDGTFSVKFYDKKKKLVKAYVK